MPTAAALANTVIIHTCAVTAEADRQARQTIRRSRRERPGTRIVVTGCGAQVGPAEYEAMPRSTIVVGNAEKLRPETWARLARRCAAAAGGRHHGGRARPRTIWSPGLEGRTRAFLQVQQGCDHRCTFCIIPFGRGPSRSVPLPAIVAQARALIARAMRAGGDRGRHCLLRARPARRTLARRHAQAAARQVPELARLRLSSYDPAVPDAALWDLIAGEPRLLPHLHLSVQAGDDLVLKRMKRRHCAPTSSA